MTEHTGSKSERAVAWRAEAIAKGNLQLAAYGLPNPLDPEATTCHRYDWKDATKALLEARNRWQPLTHRLPSDEAQAAIVEYLDRVEIIRSLWTESMDDRYDDMVVLSGSADDYAWAIYEIEWPRGDRFWLVSWFDGVAQWEVQLVADMDAAMDFLRALAEVVRLSNEDISHDGLAERWRDNLPVDTTGWTLSTQVTVDIALNEDGTPRHVIGPIFFDPDFILGFTDPADDTFYEADGTAYPQEGEERIGEPLPDHVAEVWGAVTGGEVPVRVLGGGQ